MPWGDSGPRQLPGARGALTAPLCREIWPGPGRICWEWWWSRWLLLLQAVCHCPGPKIPYFFSPFFRAHRHRGCLWMSHRDVAPETAPG